MNKTEIPLKEIEKLADYCEMDLINGVQMNQEEWTDVVDKVRAWLDKNAEGHALVPDAACGHASSDNWKIDERGNMYCVICRAGKATPEPKNAFEWLRQQGRRSPKWKGRRAGNA